METISELIYDRTNIELAVKGFEDINEKIADFISAYRFGLLDITSDMVVDVVSTTEKYSQILLDEIRNSESVEIDQEVISQETIDFTIGKIYSRVEASKELHSEYEQKFHFSEKDTIVPFNFQSAETNIEDKLKDLTSNNLTPLLKLDLATECLELIEHSNYALYSFMEAADDFLLNHELDNSADFSMSDWRDSVFDKT